MLPLLEELLEELLPLEELLLDEPLLLEELLLLAELVVPELLAPQAARARHENASIAFSDLSDPNIGAADALGVSCIKEGLKNWP